MRRGWYGYRSHKGISDEFSRFIKENRVPAIHQARNENTRCTECWDDIVKDYSPNCQSCSGSGYSVTAPGNLSRISAVISYNQPPGNSGNAAQFFKAGGEHVRYAAYIYVDLNTGKTIKAGDRIIVNLSGLRQELVVMNNTPIQAGMKTMGWVCECATGANQALEDVVI